MTKILVHHWHSEYTLVLWPQREHKSHKLGCSLTLWIPTLCLPHTGCSHVLLMRCIVLSLGQARPCQRGKCYKSKREHGHRCPAFWCVPLSQLCLVLYSLTHFPVLLANLWIATQLHASRVTPSYVFCCFLSSAFKSCYCSLPIIYIFPQHKPQVIHGLCMCFNIFNLKSLISMLAFNCTVHVQGISLGKFLKLRK